MKFITLLQCKESDFTSLSTKAIDQGVFARYGNTEGASTIAALVFDERFSEDSAKEWALKHQFKTSIDSNRTPLLALRDVNEAGSVFTRVADTEDWQEGDGESFDTLFNWIHKAVREKYYKPGEGTQYELYKVWQDKVVLKKGYWVEKEDLPLFVHHAYSLEYPDNTETGKVVLDEGQAVRLIFVPTDSKVKGELAAVREHEKESFDSFSLTESTSLRERVSHNGEQVEEFREAFDNLFTESTKVVIKDDSAIIRGIVVLSRYSLNRREYPDRVQESAVPIFEGAKAYIDHLPDGQEDNARGVRDLIGTYRNLRFDKEAHKTIADLHLSLTGDVKEHILPHAKANPNIMGCSIVAAGVINKEGVVQKITACRSIDLVSEPATTKGLFEQHNHRTELNPKEGEETMELKDILANKDIYTQVRDHVMKEAETVKKWTDMEEDNKRLREENLSFKAEAAQVSLEKSVDDIIASSKLPETFKSDPDLRKILIEAKDNEARKGLIEHYTKIAGKIPTVAPAVFKEKKIGSNNGGVMTPDVLALAAQAFNARG
jgi:hypothetical protein